MRAFAGRGVALGVHYHRSREDAEALVAELKAAGCQAWPLQADLRSAAAVAHLFSRLDELAGPLGVLVNNAAVYEPCALEDLDPETWDRTLQTNLRAPYLCTREAARRMRQRGGGAVVNVADLAALQAWPGHAHHVASKAGLIALTRSLARELGPSIRVNAVAPGLVLRGGGISAERWTALEQRVPCGRGGSPEDVAAAVLLLAESEALQGVVLPVDGGRSLGRREPGEPGGPGEPG